MKTEYGHLIVNLRLKGDEPEAIQIMAYDANGQPNPIYVELASGLRPCRCGAELTRAKFRVVAPKHIRINRVISNDDTIPQS